MDIEKVKSLLDVEFAFFWDIIVPNIQELNLKKSAKILDVGTGIGKMAITLALHGYEVLTGEPADDTSEYGKREWLESAKKVGVDHLITFKEYNAEDMPFEDNSFDAIFFLGALHHVNDKTSAIKECIRVLKPKGVICVIEPNQRGMRIVRKRHPEHPDQADPREFEKEFPLSIDYRKGRFYDSFLIKTLE